jgi:hypothetical protein
MIIVGAALGAFITSNPPKVTKAAFQGALNLPKGPRYKREEYVALLKLVYDILMKIRKEGVMAIEADLEKPEASPIFKKYPVVLADHHMTTFITDCLRLIVGGNLDPHELESLLESPAHRQDPLLDGSAGRSVLPQRNVVGDRREVAASGGDGWASTSSRRITRKCTSPRTPCRKWRTRCPASASSPRCSAS